MSSKLPVWGQRWAGYRAPHGPSSFSTRVFSVHGMSEVGPVLTSPTQFEMTLTDEDDGEDTNSESNHLYSSFYPSPRAMDVGAIKLASRPETPTPQSVHLLSNRPHGVPSMTQRSTGRSPPPNSTYFSTMLPPVQQPEQSGVQHYASEPFLHLLPPPQYTTPIQCGHEPLGSSFGLRDMDRTSANSQFRVGPSRAGFVPSGQLQHIVPPQLVPEWRFADSQTHLYPSLPNPSSNSDSGYLLEALPDDNQAMFIPAMPPPSFHCFRMPPDEQNVGVDSFWDHGSSPTGIPGIMDPRNPTMAPWPLGSVPASSEFHPGPVEISESSSLTPAWPLRHAISDHRNSSHPENALYTYPVEGCMLAPLDEPENGQFRR